MTSAFTTAISFSLLRFLAHANLFTVIGDEGETLTKRGLHEEMKLRNKSHLYILSVQVGTIAIQECAEKFIG